MPAHSVLHRLIRHHARPAILTALLPYVLASMFVNFFHTDSAPAFALCADHSVTSVEAAPVDGQQPFQHPQDPCPACVWLKVGGTRLEAPVSVVPVLHTVDVAPVIAPAIVPLSPVRHRLSLRGPPVSATL